MNPTTNERGKELDILLQKMIDLDSSDMHLAHNNPITFRIHKNLHKTKQYIKGPDIFKLLNSAAAISNMQLSTFHKTQAANFAYEYNNIRFRGSLTREQGEYTCVIRRLSDKAIPIEKIGLPELVKRQIQKQDGLILVTGPTGSGKTTTLTSLIDFLNEHFPYHITTIEDPIEYVHKPKKAMITQQEVGKDTPSFAESMRNILRRDPDVILVGEMRDLETIETAVTAAETGHLVFGTLHTNTAVSSIDRVTSVFPPIQQQSIRSQLASNLRMIINQRLYPKLNGGVVAAYEILVINKEIRTAIRQDKLEIIEDLMRKYQNEGNLLMEDSVKRLQEKGIISDHYIVS